MSSESQLLADVEQIAQASSGNTPSTLWTPDADFPSPSEGDLLAYVAKAAQASPGCAPAKPWTPEVATAPPSLFWPNLPTPAATESGVAPPPNPIKQRVLTPERGG